MPRLFLLAFGLFVAGMDQQLLSLEIRVFRGTEDVTSQSRVLVHPAGERGHPIAQAGIGDARVMKVPAGIYDAQAVQEHGGRVVNIRWAERLVVMPYPDEAGHHLEVINFTPGYGALQIRGSTAGAPVDAVALFLSHERMQPVATLPAQHPYILFVVRAGLYDIQVKRALRATWHNNIEVPLDRTRLWIVP